MSQPDTPKPRKSLLSALAFFGDRRALVMLALGFSAGLPYLLVFDTLSAWLRVANLSIEVIGYFSLATIASSLKFLWAPLIDRANIPVLTARLGHRRSWMLVSQAAIIVGLWLIAGSNPAENLGLVAFFAVCIGFSSATQDIVIDAWRIEAAPQERQGMMAAAYQWGYRIAQIIAGALALALADHYGWAFSYTVMAALMAALRDEKQVDARGMELDPANVAECVARGLSVIQGDANADLADYPPGAFDYAILSQTLQTTMRADLVVEQLLRIGRKAFVSFPNFAHWRVRLSLLWGGRMPVTRLLPVAWYETPNIHHVTIDDFHALVKERGITVEGAWFLSGDRLTSAAAANFRAEHAVFLLSR